MDPATLSSGCQPALLRFIVPVRTGRAASRESDTLPTRSGGWYFRRQPAIVGGSGVCVASGALIQHRAEPGQSAANMLAANDAFEAVPALGEAQDYRGHATAMAILARCHASQTRLHPRPRSCRANSGARQMFCGGGTWADNAVQALAEAIRGRSDGVRDQPSNTPLPRSCAQDHAFKAYIGSVLKNVLTVSRGEGGEGGSKGWPCVPLPVFS
jgi:hypothetical protein